MRFEPCLRAGVLPLGLCLMLGACGCSGSPDSPLLDPDAVGSDQGTLVSIGDIRAVAQEMIHSMNQSPTLTALRAGQRPLRIEVGRFKQRTSIAIFDRRIFLNRLLSSLAGADADGFYTFVAPPGSLAPAPAPAPAGAPQATAVPEPLAEAPPPPDLVLEGELREILLREAAPGGGILETRTVQYTLKLLRPADSSVAWARSQEIVKQQVQGAVYQ